MKTQTCTLTSGERKFEIEVNAWAEKAAASVVVRSGDSLVLVTLTKGEMRPEADFVPLTIDYEEKYAAVGKLYGSRFVRREGRPSETAILNGRFIDRSIRPAIAGFPPQELQIVTTVFSLDDQNEPDLMAFLGSSVAVDLLGWDWLGPVAAVRLIRRGEQFICNPLKNKDDNHETSSRAAQFSEKIVNREAFNLLVAGTATKINMIEFEGHEVAEALLEEAHALAQKEITRLSKEIRIFTDTLVKERTKPVMPTSDQNFDPATAREQARAFATEHKLDLEALLFSGSEGDDSSAKIFKTLQEQKEILGDKFGAVQRGLLEEIKAIFKKKIMTTKTRPDGRTTDQIRKLEAIIAPLPRVHGSALFQRGLTHVMGSITLGSPGDEQLINEIEFEGTKRILHHYNFPRYSTGETGRMGATGRREIGHGALAEKALKQVIPPETDFPYIVRIVSDTLSSNGSTSMASVCAGCLALMDAGVPISGIVTGISIGLIHESDDQYLLLTDIQGPEDFYGCMDFKVAATERGVVAIQMDTKIEGLTVEMVRGALEQAKQANAQLRTFIQGVIPAPRPQFKNGVPYVTSIQINPEKIGLVIGGGGRTIQEITKDTETKIDIRPDGTIFIAGPQPSNLEQAQDRIRSIAFEPEIGATMRGEVVKILPFGAIIELEPAGDGLLHISEIADHRIDKVEDELHLGQILNVRVKAIGSDGKISLSLKNVQPLDTARDS